MAERWPCFHGLPSSPERWIQEVHISFQNWELWGGGSGDKQSCNPHLNAFIEDAASLSSFLSFPAGGVPVRLLAPLSSLPRTKLPPGPRFLRPLLLREPNMLEGPKDGGWLVLLVLLRRRRSSLPTLLDAKSGGGAWFLKSPEKLRASPRPKGGRPPLLACWRRRSISASCCWRIAWKNELECLCHKIGNTTA